MIMNDFLEAAENSDEVKEGSRERYEKVKKEEAGTDSSDPVKQRYNELKEKAKKEYKKQEEERSRKREKESEDEEDDDEKNFITY